MRAEIERRFTYHPTPDERTRQTYIRIRERAKELALLFDDVTPDSREKSLALTKLEEAVIHANSAIARNGLRPHNEEPPA